MPMPWEQDYHGETGAPATTGSMPWDRDWSHLNQQEGDFLHPTKPAAGSGWRGVLERVTQYPRIAVGQLADAWSTLARVAHGEIDAADPQAIAAAAIISSTVGPASVGAGTGSQIARMAEPGYTATPKLSPGMAAAQTAAEAGSPLPAGIVSDTPAVKSFTQGFRQFPFVGPTITEKVGETVNAIGKRVGDISEELSGGPVSDRATVGANTRQALQDVIEENNSRIDSAYNDLRTNHIDPEATAPLSRTRATLDAIKADRAKAGMANPSAALGDIETLVGEDRSFNGLQRARSAVGQLQRASRDNPNPGFIASDFKRLYGAMSQDMKDLARRHALSDPDEAAAALDSANGTAQNLINRNGAIQRLLNNQSDEGMLGSIINSARDKGGNLRQLAELRAQLPKEDFEKISGIALHELGHTPDGFSLNQFSGKRGWGGLSPSAKTVLIADPNHRRLLDSYAGVGSFLKDADKYRNTSNTAHSAGITGALIGAYHLATSGDVHQLLAALGGAAGGYGLSKILARPASASALRRWLDAAVKRQRVGPAQFGAANATLAMASRNLMNNLPDFPERFASPMPDTRAQQGRRDIPIPQSDPRKAARKIQDRMTAY